MVERKRRVGKELSGIVDARGQMVLTVSEEGVETLFGRQTLEGRVLIVGYKKVPVSAKVSDAKNTDFQILYGHRTHHPRINGGWSIHGYDITLNWDKLTQLKEKGFAGIETWQLRQVSLYTQSFREQRGLL